MLKKTRIKELNAQVTNLNNDIADLSNALADERDIATTYQKIMSDIISAWDANIPLVVLKKTKSWSIDVRDFTSKIQDAIKIAAPVKLLYAQDEIFLGYLKRLSTAKDSLLSGKAQSDRVPAKEVFRESMKWYADANIADLVDKADKVLPKNEAVLFGSRILNTAYDTHASIQQGLERCLNDLIVQGNDSKILYALEAVSSIYTSGVLNPELHKTYLESLQKSVQDAAKIYLDKKTDDMLLHRLTMKAQAKDHPDIAKMMGERIIKTIQPVVESIERGIGEFAYGRNMIQEIASVYTPATQAAEPETNQAPQDQNKISSDAEKVTQ